MPLDSLTELSRADAHHSQQHLVHVDLATTTPSVTCPVGHSAYFQKKTAAAAEPADLPDVEQDADGTWHIRGFQEARTILRDGNTKQAGFRAELVERLSGEGNIPILYQEGKTHQQQRKQTARFFTPKAVSSDYRHLMETVADELIADLQRDKRADLSALSLALAVRVAAAVVGLTNSRRPGMPKRLEAFFTVDAGDEARRWRHSLTRIWRIARSQLHFLAFYYLDVKPAIEARKRQPAEDVISHLLAQGYRDREILTECVTYGAAGMVTTREFISIATWHLLEQSELRARYLATPEAERLALLEEILRLEPVVGHLYRRATSDIRLRVGAESVTIPQGALMDLHIHAANTDERVAGEHPFAIRPYRELHEERAGPALLSFGDGAHRCPGSYIALQETDIFLLRLLAVEGLRMEHAPVLGWNELVTGYELRDFPIAVA